MSCCCCRVVFHGLVGRGDKVLRAVQLFVVAVVFVFPLVFGRERGGREKVEVEKKITNAGERRLHSRDEFSLSRRFNSLSHLSLLSFSP